jgi:hypothetical protein
MDFLSRSGERLKRRDVRAGEMAKNNIAGAEVFAWQPNRGVAISSTVRSIPLGLSSIAPCMNIAKPQSKIIGTNEQVEAPEVETLIDLRETRPMPASTVRPIRAELLTIPRPARMTIAKSILALTAAQPTMAS